MPFEIFYVERLLNRVDEPDLEEIPKKEHYKTKRLALGRVRELFNSNCHHSILLACGSNYVLGGFRLGMEADLDESSNEVPLRRSHLE